MVVYKYVMPEEKNSVMSFERWVREAQRHPIAIYADFETYHEKPEGDDDDDEVNDNSTDGAPRKITQSGTTVLDTHRPYAAAYYLALSTDFEEVIKKMLSKNDRLRALFPEYPDNL